LRSLRLALQGMQSQLSRGGSLTLWLCTGALWVACGGAEVKAPPARERIEWTTAQGIRISTIVRPTPEVVHLALWIDAGSRDASVPQIATVAAWIAAYRAGGSARAYATPDGIELSLRCHSKAVSKCLHRLSAALATREVSEAQARQALGRLVADRRRAEVADEGRTADRLAVTELLGPAARGFFPLGTKEDDAAVTAQAISSFMRNHFGPERSLLIAVGDVDKGNLVSLVEETFQGVPAAKSARVARDLRSSKNGVTAVLDSVSAVSVAVTCPDLGTAAAVARMLSRALKPGAQAADPVRPGGFAVAVRGGALALVRVAANEPVRVVREAAFEYARLKKEGIPRITLSPQMGGLFEIARETGLRWCARGGPTLTETLGPGVGVSVYTGRGSQKPSNTDPDMERTRQIAEQIERAYAEGRRQALEPEIKGDVERDTASVTAANGARIEVRRRDDQQVALAVAVQGGSGFDAAALHGRSALLATLAATACQRMPADRLTVRLEDLGATLEPTVDSESFGLVLTAPSRVWRDALELAMGCALYPSLESTDIVRARLRLRERFGRDGSALWFSHRAAQLISPALPGRIAFWGSPASAANVSEAELSRYAAEAIVGSRLRVAVVGDVPVQEAVERIVRRIGDLPKGTPAQKLAVGRPKGDLNSSFVPQTSEERGDFWVISVWRASGSIDGAQGARAFAALMRAALDERAGVQVVWRDAGSDSAGSWTALGLKVSGDALAGLDPLLGEVAQSLASRSFDQTIDGFAQQAFLADSEAGARSRVEAERLARNRVEAGKKASSFQSIRQVARALVASPASWWVLGPVSL
jgi:predicted Zn-dependent peptidase